MSKLHGILHLLSDWFFPSSHSNFPSGIHCELTWLFSHSVHFFLGSLYVSASNCKLCSHSPPINFGVTGGNLPGYIPWLVHVILVGAKSTPPWSGNLCTVPSHAVLCGRGGCPSFTFGINTQTAPSTWYGGPFPHSPLFTFSEHSFISILLLVSTSHHLLPLVDHPRLGWKLSTHPVPISAEVHQTPSMPPFPRPPMTYFCTSLGRTVPSYGSGILCPPQTTRFQQTPCHIVACSGQFGVVTSTWTFREGPPVPGSPLIPAQTYGCCSGAPGSRWQCGASDRLSQPLLPWIGNPVPFIEVLGPIFLIATLCFVFAGPSNSGEWLVVITQWVHPDMVSPGYELEGDIDRMRL